MPETDSQQIKLPDRLEITLCEAVTAFVYGNAIDARRYMIDDETTAIEDDNAKVKDLIKRLQEAAYAGRITFRALKDGDTHADGHRHIDRLYFSENRGFRWHADEIWVCDLSVQHPKFTSNRAFKMDWHDVHLVREDFVSLLRGISVSLIQGLETNDGTKNASKTGLPGRPTSKYFVLQMAQRRLESGNFPSTLTALSKELAKALRSEHPEAVPATPRTIENAIRELWRAHQKPPKSAGPSGS
jgi:hypothetical protein